MGEQLNEMTLHDKAPSARFKYLARVTCVHSPALFWAREDRYSNALPALNSVGVAGHNDNNAYQDFLKRHPCSSFPSVTSRSQSSLTVDESIVLICLATCFP